MRDCPKCHRTAYAFVGDICEDCDNDKYQDDDYERE